MALGERMPAFLNLELSNETPSSVASTSAQNVEVPTLVTYTQNVEQVSQFLPQIFKVHQSLRERGPEGVAESNRHLDAVEAAARKQVENVQAFREKMRGQGAAVPRLLEQLTRLPSIDMGTTMGSTKWGVQLVPGADVVSFMKTMPFECNFDTESVVLVDPEPFALGNVFRTGTSRQWLGKHKALIEQTGQRFALPATAEEGGPGYWSSVRDRLLESLSVSLHELSAILGLSYGNVQALGKRRPQTKTTRPLLRLDGLVRAYLAADPERGARWLRAEGSELLHKRGIDAFQAVVDRKIFAERSETARLYGHIADDDRELIFTNEAAPPATTGEDI